MTFQAESSVLGAILLQPDLIDECYLQPQEFEDDRHQLIMQYMRFLNDIDRPIDLVVMAEFSGKNLAKIGGISYLSELASAVPTTANFNYYQDIIRKSYMQRRATDAFKELASNETEDINERVGIAQSAIDEIMELSETEREIIKMSEALKDHDKTIIKRRNQRGMTGAKTASLDLDRMTGGHQDGDFEVIAARPSIGKTAYVINDMVQAAKDSVVVMFSLEMDKKQVAERAICAIGNIDSKRMRTGQFDEQDWERWSYAMDALEQLPIYIDDTPGITVQQINAKVKRLKKRFPKLIMYVDYLQLVQPGRKFNQTREAVTFVSRQLKQIARNNGCPVVAISSVSRSCEQRQDKRPMMSDLKESGDIEFEADIILFLYRDDYYNPNTVKKGIVEVIVGKGRNVGTGTIEMAFQKSTGKFLNIDRTKKEGGPK